MYKKILAVAVIAVIIVVIWYLEDQKTDVGIGGDSLADITLPTNNNTSMKEKKFPKAKEIVSPAGFINTDTLKVSGLIGKQVILVDFWTYSCINCQRTLPYLNAWQEKYGDMGLTIIGVHTPEFEFEKKLANVQAAVDKYDIAYPVVLDNDYATWRAYGNRYWPRKYLIDIDGYIVYDHIGEGAYDETEGKIQELLTERSQRLGEEKNIVKDMVKPVGAETVASNQARTPEIYFGSKRNEHLGNSKINQSGAINLSEDGQPQLDEFYLTGHWNITPEYSESQAAGAKITLRYRGQKVFFVAGSETKVQLKITRDGQSLGAARGSSVASDGTVTVVEEDLYRLVEDAVYGEHVLEIEAVGPGLRAFTFTFG
ncbi:MAG: redoxin family protein [bacterium]|nr:redoxin family protein [bacterium]